MVVHGNRLEDLRDLAVEWMRAYPLAPLENEAILVQSNGIAQWLKLALARDDGEGGGCGIAAALDVQLPARFLWQAYRTVLGAEDVPRTSPFDKAPLLWRLMRKLPELLAQPVFEPLRAFLHDDGDLRKRYQLAERLADLFDQYQVYRADWLADWAAGQDRLRLAHGGVRALDARDFWQPALWRALLEELGEDRYRHSRAAVHRRFVEAARELSRIPTELPRRVIVFGISSLPSQTLEALQALSGQLQVMLFVHNPCEYHWADIIAGKDLLRARQRRQAARPGMPAELNQHDLHLHAHPLLAAWGKQGRDYIGLLEEYDQPERYRALFSQRIDLFEPHGGGSLLNQLQDDIRELRPLHESREHWPAVAADDDSLRFHIAHSPQREVEVLHDQLLARFAADPELRPRDVIVMVPDIDRYAPHIQAVFGRIAPDDPRHIPFSVSDQGSRGREPLLIALERLLSLPESRFAVSDLLDLLDVPALRRRFGLEATDLPLLRRWIEGAGVRWGLHAEQRASLDLPHGQEQNSWRFGLRRMLLGYAVGRGEAWSGIEPYAEVGGLEAAALGSLVELLDTLERWWRRVAEPAAAQHWAARLGALLEELFMAEEGREALLLASLGEALDDWLQACEQADLDEALPLTVVRESWLAMAEERARNQRLLAGAVSFATLMPMRAIPFRLVCLLGMNDGDYPRSAPPLDFDLMAGDLRPGDRSRREDDRYLFLEALLSARRQLYISWVGASIRDNSARPPSVLVAQLRDHLAAGWRLAEGGELLPVLTTRHPLQPFSPANFPAEPATSPLFSYAREWAGVAGGQAAARAEPLGAPGPDTALDLSALQTLLRDPAEAFFRQRLKVHFDPQGGARLDQEPFALDRLQLYQLRDAVLQRVVAAPPARAADIVEQELARLRRSGQLPPGTAGELWLTQHLREPLDKLLDTAGPLLERYRPSTEPQWLSLACEGGWQLEDWLTGLRVDAQGRRALIHTRAGELGEGTKLRHHALLRLWLQHLAGNALGEPLSSYMLATDGTLCLEPLAPEPAREALRALVNAWRANQCAPLPVACRSSFAWLRAEEAGKDPGAAARECFDGGYTHAGERARSPYLARVFEDFDALLASEEFHAWRNTLYTPLFAAAGSATLQGLSTEATP
ncbi:exodeoxyribonuclease V subunit gamma [Alkalilimnicola sp. S0819]|nr:exodeoxyribonuclease V subunit gamma [Alkalilimnicola sp. S0819]MPQ15400.1 exodeoxyribonuclease V subunit gamma [Alkalilimnicola sp. S0819]